jgi:DNA-binding transcriptional MocR family regulator
MTIWQPDLADDGRPKYRALADTLAADIRAGRLAPGTRLPPQRDLAYRLGVTVGTVGRAYEIVTQAGLAIGEVGRGTYVRTNESVPRTGMADARLGMTDALKERPGSTVVPMRSNLPADIGQDAEIDAAARRVMDRTSLGRLSAYIGSGGSGSDANRAAAAAWIARSGLKADPESVVITGGAQSAIATAVLTGSKPGDLIVAGELTYPSVSDLARILDRRIAGIAIDDDGLRPDAFARACREQSPALLFDVPTLHNPTCSTMPARRRDEIVAIARDNGVRIIEDEVYANILEADERPPAFAALYPEGTFLISGMSKSVAPGLRCGFLSSPAQSAARARATHYNLTLGSATLMADVATDLIETGVARDLVMRQRREVAARKRLAADLLAGADYRTVEGAPHIWLTLPDPWRSATFAQAALGREVTIGTAEEFMVDQQAAAVHKVRICLGTPHGADDAARGLGVITELLANGPGDLDATV